MLSEGKRIVIRVCAVSLLALLATGCTPSNTETATDSDTSISKAGNTPTTSAASPYPGMQGAKLTVPRGPDGKKK